MPTTPPQSFYEFVCLAGFLFSLVSGHQGRLTYVATMPDHLGPSAFVWGGFALWAAGNGPIPDNDNSPKKTLDSV